MTTWIEKLWGAFLKPDRSQQQLVSGAPVPEDWSHTKLKANGQQEDFTEREK